MRSPDVPKPLISKHRQRPGSPPQTGGLGGKESRQSWQYLPAPTAERQCGSLTSVLPHSQDAGVLLGEKEKEGNFRATALSTPAGRGALHSCALLDQIGLKREEQRFPRKGKVIVCTRSM